MQFLRRNWVGLMFCALGLMMVLGYPVVRHRQHAYAAAAPCPPGRATSTCRLSRAVQVATIDRHVSSHGAVTRRITFRAGAGSYEATFDGDDLPTGVVQSGQAVTVELWHRKVTGMTIGGTTYRSLYVQKAPWWLVPLGLLLAALGALMMKTGVAGSSV